MSKTPTIAIVGATGAVGRELLSLLAERETPVGELRLLASARSAGSEVAFRGERLVVEELSEQALQGADLAFFTASGQIARDWAPALAERGVWVVDNSSAFRMAEGHPLVVPQVNPDALDGTRLIANPNCSTILLMMALDPLRRAFGLERAVVATYQAVSGAGAAAMDELVEQTRAVLAEEAREPGVFGEPCAFNVFNHDSPVDPETGANVEEQKMVDEARKIWEDPTLAITATCVRVPVLRAHSEAVNLTLERPAAESEVRAAFAAALGVRVVDDRAGNRFPTPLAASGRDEVLVGRIRADRTQGSAVGDADRYRGWSLFLAGDQLRKGAALNALEIAELLPPLASA